MTEQVNAETQGQTSSASAGAQPTAQASPSAESGAQAAASELARPDWAPEAFWDAKTGFKAEDAAKQLQELTAFKAQVEAKAGAVPKEPDAYELKLPADLKLPDGVEFQLNPDDPMVALGRKIAHESGIDQPGFEKMVGLFAQQKVAEAQQVQALVAKQMEALGAKGAERKAAVETWLTAKAGPLAMDLFGGALMTKAGVEALEAIMRDNASGGAAPFTQAGRTAQTGQISEDDYSRMSPADRLVFARKAQAAGAR